MLEVYDLFRAAQSAYRGRNSFKSIQMLSQTVISGGWRNSMIALHLGPLELQLGQSCSNRSNFTFKRSTWAYSDVERKEFGENFGTCVRAIRQDGSNGKDPKPLWFR
ncbi:hypothetical protein TNIN_166071, partial [Trichonephila inaurata madagascariensis]